MSATRHHKLYNFFTAERASWELIYQPGEGGLVSRMANFHDGKCGPCHLCKRESTKYTHFTKMDSTVSKLIGDIEQLTLTDKACVCHHFMKCRQSQLSPPAGS